MNSPTQPVVVSFAAGADHYHQEARRLQQACERLGLPHSIDFVQDLGDLDWSQICRYKVRFYQRKLEELQRPILWVDADTLLLKEPLTLVDQRADFAAFLNRSYLNVFDAYSTARMWRPSHLYFGYTPAARGFLQHMVDLDAASPSNVTDDYVLQESWATYPTQMTVLVLPSKHAARRAEDVGEETWLVHGQSGNVEDFRGRVLQHRTILNRGEILTEIAGDYLKRREYPAAESLLLAARDYGWDGPAHTRRLAETLRQQKRHAEADDTVHAFLDRHPEDPAAMIMASKVSIRQADHAGAEQLLRAAAATTSPAAAEAESLLFDVQQERKAREMGLKKPDRPALWWMKQPYPGNLGDVLNPYIVEKLTGRPPRYVRRGTSMLAIGSVIKFAQDGCDVWGTGTPRMTDELNPRARYHAVRGPLTRELVLSSGGSAPEIYGDAALLLPRFYTPTNTTKRHAVGLIRHVSQAGLGQTGEGVRDLNLLRVGYAEIEAFLEELSECETVVSTSLHGMIIANAYGIPARWATFSDAPRKIAGDGTKYLDYLRSVDVPDQTPLDLTDFGELNDSLARHVDPRSADIQFDGDALTEAFPWAP